MKRAHTATALSALLLTTLACALLLVSIQPAGAAGALMHPDEEKRQDEREEKVARFEEIVTSDDDERLEKAFNTVTAEEDPWVAREMGERFALFTAVEEIEVMYEYITRELDEEPEQAYIALYIMIGVAKGKTERGDQLLEDVLFEADDDLVLHKAAAIEAIRMMHRKDLAHLVARAMNPEKKDSIKVKDWMKGDVVLPTAGVVAARELYNSENKIQLMTGIVNVMEKTLDERCRWHALQSAAKITGELPIDDVKFWRIWIKTNGDAGDEKRESGRTNAKPPSFFNIDAVGRRLIYIIDISGSMENPWRASPELIDPKDDGSKPITGDDDEEKRKDEDGNVIEPPDYALIDTKIGLAKAELIYAIRQLNKDYKFNVVVYEMDHNFLIDDMTEFYPANSNNRQKFIDAVEELEPTATTNMHGAITRGFRTTTEGYLEDEHPGTSEDAILHGADTLFFLTDGWPTWSDDSEEWDSRANSGDGAFCNADMILADIWRTNVFRRCVIHTIGIGNHDSKLLKKLSSAHHGNYRDMKGD